MHDWKNMIKGFQIQYDASYQHGLSYQYIDTEMESLTCSCFPRNSTYSVFDTDILTFARTLILLYFKKKKENNFHDVNFGGLLIPRFSNYVVM